MAIAGLRKLCTPAYVYLVISMIAILVMAIQNYNNVDVYCLGDYSCNNVNVTLLFIIKFVYVLFWTWILNLICNAGATNLAWFLVIFPFLLLFILLALLMFS